MEGQDGMFFFFYTYDTDVYEYIKIHGLVIKTDFLCENPLHSIRLNFLMGKVGLVSLTRARGMLFFSVLSFVFKTVPKN